MPDTGWRRSFWALFLTQFQGAFSDNLFKFLVVFTIIFEQFPLEQRDQHITLIAIVFTLPMILFAMAGGYCADRYGKARVIQYTKVAEVLIMLLGTLALAWQWYPFALVVVFLMSVQSAYFGPSKYGALPEILPESRLSWGNGVIALGTFTSIIAGGLLAGVLADKLKTSQAPSGLLLVVLALVGWGCSKRIQSGPPADPDRRFHWFFLKDIWTNLKLITGDRVLYLAVRGSAFFWGIAALLDMNILMFGQQVLDLDNTQISLLRSAVALGIGFGSGAAGVLSGRKIEYGLVPLGALGITLAGIAVGVLEPDFTTALACIGLLGFSGGFFIVPINALIQYRPDAACKGSVIATENWLNSFAIFASAGVYFLFSVQLNWDSRTIFIVCGLLTLAATVYACRLVPDSLLRLVGWLITHTVYRIRIRGAENLPEKGGALLVSNHMSYVDALLILASTDRTIRYIMHREIYEVWWIRPFARMMKAVPVASDQGPREMLKSLDAASDWLRQGEVVCIFAEGQISRTGQLMPFRKGLERILKDVEVPVIPVHLDGVWGSIFSYAGGKYFWKWPKQLPYPVTVSFGEPLPSSIRPYEIREAVQMEGAEAWEHRRSRMIPFGKAFLRQARRQWHQAAWGDADHLPLTWGEVLTRSVLMARRLSGVWGQRERVGICLPPGVASACVNAAAILGGRVVVNLNYTLSPDALASCMRQAGIDKVITSRGFLEALGDGFRTVPWEPVYLEDLLSSISLEEKVKAWFQAQAGTYHGFLKAFGTGFVPDLDSVLTVVFSSGSTGEPRGVELTHFNIQSNVDQLITVFDPRPSTRFLGVLPFFHSFGFTGTWALSCLQGKGVTFHHSPLDARTIGKLVKRDRLEFLLATPTFLQIYIKGCSPAQFGSLRWVLAGAERLTPATVAAFRERFGIEPLEAYGCTECAPAVTVNLPDIRMAGIHQVGNKSGSIGHALPGVCVRILDPETLQPLKPGEPGLMWVKGPNVMKGYLGRPEWTREVLFDGGYLTGDIASLDEDGFVRITDRLSRFSKIGGEMISHGAVEEALQSWLGNVDRRLVVTGVPDERKGEKLIVLHTLDNQELAELRSHLDSSELPNLFRPRGDAFIHVNAIPLLGSGKLDLQRLKKWAIQGRED